MQIYIALLTNRKIFNMNNGIIKNVAYTMIAMTYSAIVVPLKAGCV
jgi:hypothetical protein